MTNNIFHDTFPSLGCEMNTVSATFVHYTCIIEGFFYYFFKVEGFLRLSRQRKLGVFGLRVGFSISLEEGRVLQVH